MNTLTKVKERGILFKGEMVRAILSGQKTMTRRIIKPQPEPSEEFGYTFAPPKREEHASFAFAKDPSKSSLFLETSPFQVGMILWVKEAYALHFMWNGCPPRDWKPTPTSGTPCIWYKADNSVSGGCTESQKGKGWRSPLFMPREACRIRLEITSVRVERLVDISEDDAIAEGIKTVDWMHLPTSDPCACGYSVLWEKINGKGSWNESVWVWVIEFRRI